MSRATLDTLPFGTRVRLVSGATGVYASASATWARVLLDPGSLRPSAWQWDGDQDGYRVSPTAEVEVTPADAGGTTVPVLPPQSGG